MDCSKQWHIENRESGVVLGVYDGATEREALDAMARDAGYAHYVALQAEVPGDDLDVDEVLVWKIKYEGGQVGEMALFIESGRGYVAKGSDPSWGDWEGPEGAEFLRIDSDPEVCFDQAGEETSLPEKRFALEPVAQAIVDDEEWTVYSDEQHTWAIPTTDYERLTSCTDYSDWCSSTRGAGDERLCARIAQEAGLSGLYACGTCRWVDAEGAGS